MTSTRAKTWLSLSGKYKKFLAENVQSCFVLSNRKSGYNIDHWIIRSQHHDISY